MGITIDSLYSSFAVSPKVCVGKGWGMEPVELPLDPPLG